MLRLASVVAASLATGACATVHIEVQSKDDVEVKTRFGIISLELRPGARSVVVNSSSLGVVNTLEGLAVGYHSTSYAALAPNDCRIVLWIHTNDQLKELDRLLRERTDVCVIQGLNSTGGKP